ncbi:MAG: UMP kinase [Hyphomicrobiales bacterium]|nr:MAG: UMP kinase [Hyphomicrobiales bacterium]|tara:strand:+ start:480 stop:1193 length:714 start_codon:yes stop_codon:yes gene_type:complete
MAKEYKNILLKISGEILAAETNNTFDNLISNQIVEDIINLRNSEVNLAVVVGGGNIIRGINHKDFNLSKNNADNMGMLSTVINGIFLKDLLLNNQIKSIVYSSFSISGIVKKFNQEEARDAMRNGYVVILVGGTGNPYFTTDTTAVLRALELGCDVLLKGTKVDGIYDKDPEKFSKVKKFTKLDYKYVINNKLRIMDMTSIIMAEEANLPIIIFSIKKKNELKKVIDKETEYTIISN